MNINLAKNVRVVFLGDVVIQHLSGEPGQSNQEIYVRTTSIPITLKPEHEDHKDKVTTLEILLNDSCSSQAGESKRKGVEQQATGPWQISIDIAIYTPTSNISRVNFLVPPSDTKGFLRVRDTASGGILERLSQVYGLGETKLTVLLENVKEKTDNLLTQMNVTEEGLIYMSPLKSYGVEKIGCDVRGVTIDQWKRTHASVEFSREWEAFVTIIAVVPGDCEYLELSMTDKCYITKKILLEQVYTDATIVAKSGVGVKCHEAFLAGHSSVLATMLQTAMQRSQKGTVDMPDMSEAGVRAFLAYLYYWEVKEAVNNSFICFELFAAGHKYDIGELKKCMEKILLAKSSEWYEVDLAMKLFLFSRKLPNGEKLKMKAVQVLKSKFNDLSKTPCYHKLFKDDLEAGMDLCTSALSF